MQFLQGFQCQLFLPNWTSRATSHQPSPRLIHLRTHALELQMKAGLQTLTSRTCILDPSPKRWWNQKSLQLSTITCSVAPFSNCSSSTFLYTNLSPWSPPPLGPRAMSAIQDPVDSSVCYSSVWWFRLVVQPFWKGWNMMELLRVEFPSTNQAWPPTTMGLPVWSNHITLPCILTSPKYHAERDVYYDVTASIYIAWNTSILGFQFPYSDESNSQTVFYLLHSVLYLYIFLAIRMHNHPLPLKHPEPNSAEAAYDRNGFIQLASLNSSVLASGGL